MKKILFSILILAGCFLISAQSDEERKVSGIISRESWENADGRTKYLSSVEKYDANGNKTEEIKYNKDKSVKKRIVCTFNSNNDKITETEFDGSGKKLQEIVYEYNGNLRIVKKEYNEKDKLVSWKTYEYKMKK